MDKPLVEMIYTLADGKRIHLEVSIEVKSLLTQADRQIRSQRRQDKRRHTEYIEGLTDTTIVFPQDDFADLVDRMDNYKRLYAVIEKLSETQRRRIILYYFGGMNHREIAEKEGVNVRTVNESVAIAREKLRKYLTE